MFLYLHRLIPTIWYPFDLKIIEIYLLNLSAVDFLVVSLSGSHGTFWNHHLGLLMFVIDSLIQILNRSQILLYKTGTILFEHGIIQIGGHFWKILLIACLRDRLDIYFGVVSSCLHLSAQIWIIKVLRFKNIVHHRIGGSFSIQSDHIQILKVFLQLIILIIADSLLWVWFRHTKGYWRTIFVLKPQDTAEWIGRIVV